MSSSRPIICVQKRTHRVFFSELTGFAAELREFSLPKQYFRNSIPPVSYTSSLSTLTLQSLLFSISLLFFVFRFSLLFCAFFLSFPRISGVPRRGKPLLFLGKNPCFFFSKKARIGGSGKVVAVGFLYGAGAEARNFGDRCLGKNLSPSRRTKNQRCIPRKPRKAEA